jgi:hypothetical protein
VYNLSHFKYARAISEAAPVAAAIAWDSDEDSDSEQRLRLQILKMRNAQLAKRVWVYLRPNMTYMRVSEGERYGRKSLNDLSPDDGEHETARGTSRDHNHGTMGPR